MDKRNALEGVEPRKLDLTGYYYLDQTADNWTSCYRHTCMYLIHTVAVPYDLADLLLQIQRMANTEECGNLIAFLLSDEAKFITGATYSIDGGWAC